MSPIDLEKLSGLSAAATKGPWGYDDEAYIYVGTPDDWKAMVAEIRGFGADLPMDTNATLIAAMRNSIDQMLAELRAGREWLRATQSGGDIHGVKVRDARETYRKLVNGEGGE